MSVNNGGNQIIFPENKFFRPLFSDLSEMPVKAAMSFQDREKVIEFSFKYEFDAGKSIQEHPDK